MLQTFKNLFKKKEIPSEIEKDEGPLKPKGNRSARAIENSIWILESCGRFYPTIKISIEYDNGYVEEIIEGCFNKETYRFGEWGSDQYFPLKTFDSNVLWFSTFEEANAWCLKAKGSKRHEVKPLSDCSGELHNTLKVVSSQFCTECNKWVEVGVSKPAPEWTEENPCLGN